MTEESSTDWFIAKARSAAGYRRNILNNEERSKTTVFTGRMYFFHYSPKYKATLPIYDRFPLVFPIERSGNSFLGINIHYLSLGARKYFLDEVNAYRNNNKYDETTKLRLSYKIIKNSRVGSLIPNCIKRYLYTHVRSPFIEIISSEWDKVADLPIELFITNKRGI